MKYIPILLTLIFFTVKTHGQEIDTTFSYFSRVFLEDSLLIESYSVLPISDGYLVAGGYITAGTNPIVYLQKLNLVGETQWVRSIDDSPSHKHFLQGTCHITTSDNNFLLTYGRTDSLGTASTSDFVVVKHDHQGQIIWSKDFGESNIRESPVCVAETIDNSGYVIGGYRQQYAPLPFSYNSLYLLKTDVNGIEQWHRQHNLISSGHTMVRTIEATSDGGFIIGGGALYLNVNNSDPFVLKLDEQGNYQWHKTYGYEHYDGSAFVKEMPDSSFLFLSGIDVGGDYAPFAATLNSEGETTQTQTYYDTAYEMFSLFQPFGQKLIALSYGKQYPPATPFLVSLDLELDTLWSKPFTWTNERDVALVDIERTLDGGFIMCGYAPITETQKFSWISKVDSLGNTCSNLMDCDSLVLDTINTGLVPRKLESPFYLNISPNPIHNAARVQYSLPQESTYAWLRIFNLHGLEVRSLRLPTAGSARELTIPEQMEAGLYVYVVEMKGRKILRGKMMVE